MPDGGKIFRRVCHEKKKAKRVDASFPNERILRRSRSDGVAKGKTRVLNLVGTSVFSDSRKVLEHGKN
jgi:hypothetical protein